LNKVVFRKIFNISEVLIFNYRTLTSWYENRVSIAEAVSSCSILTRVKPNAVINCHS